MAEAIRAGEAREHVSAAEAWERAARIAERAGATASIGQCLEAAGEAWRRADWPLKALDCLEGCVQRGQASPTTRVRTASLLADRGQGRVAEQVLREVLAQARGPERGMALDTLVSVLQGFARKVDVRRAVDELEAELGPQHPAVWFRRGQLGRLDGDLDGADFAFQQVVAAMSGQEGAEAGVAAAEMERAEIAGYRGDPGRALAAWEAGRELHRSAGRLSLSWACEAGRVRVAAEAGVAVLAPGLDGGIAWAEERGLLLLALDLRLARGASRAAARPAEALPELDAVVDQANAWGCRLRAGHARLIQRLHLADHAPARRDEWQREAQQLLVDHVPLFRRIPI